MKSLRSTVIYWFTKRFVRLIETVGYVVVVIIGLSVLYTCFMQVEITSPASGTIRPFHVDITCDADGVVVSISVSSGDRVHEGDEVCRVVTDPESVRRAQVYIGLNDVIDSLKAADQPDLKRARDGLEKVRDQIVSTPVTKSLKAPATGRLQLIGNIKPGTLFKSGEPIARVLQFNRLVMDGALGGNNADKVEVGQTARLTLDIGKGAVLVGRVTAKPEGENAVLLEFADVPPGVMNHFGNLTETEKPVPPPGAEIIVGKQSLFSYLFTRKQ